MDTQIKPGENKVFFQSDGMKLAGLLFVPPDYREGEKRPAIVVTRPASGVKEQTAGLYAQKFSQTGFVTLAFDPKGYGESEGRPQVEDCFSIISDTKNAVTYLQSLPQVDPNKVFNAGICYGAGYASTAGAEDDRIKGTAIISPALSNHIEYPKSFGGRFILRAFLTIMKPVVFLLGLIGIELYFPLAPIKGYQKLFARMPLLVAALQYYGPGKPGDHANWKNRVNIFKGEVPALDYNPFEWTAKFQNKAFFMAYADGGQRPDMLQKFYDEIHVDDKELLVFENATHFDLYYKPQFVDPVVEKVSALFKKHQ
jgi:dienelactone hydrolase